MLRAKIRSRRPARLHRSLRIEHLESRSLLSADVAMHVAAFPVADPPPVITLHAINEITDVWTFKGTVTDKNHAVAGQTVQLGGVLAKYHLTATVDADGRYEVTELLRDIRTGTATAQTSCSASTPSNVAMDFVDSRHAYASLFIPLFTAFDDVGGAGATIATVAGTSRYAGDGAAVTDASLNGPQCVVVDDLGNLFIADTRNNVIREVDASSGTIVTIAGNGLCGYSGDGDAATSGQLNAPSGIALDATGNLYIADSGNHVVRKLDLATGVITTIAGDGQWGYSGDGSAGTAAKLSCPIAVAVDSGGDLFIADSDNNVVRKVNHTTGVITTVAGSYTLGGGYGGDGYAATSAQLNYPTGVAVEGNAYLFIADACNHVVRKVALATGVITTFAGNHTLGSGYSGDDYAATSAQLSAPWGVAVDADGDLFIADSSNNAVRKVNHATGVITTVAGDGNWGYSGDGEAATSAELSDPTAVAVDAEGKLFIADGIHNAIRAVDLSTGLIETVAGNGSGNYSGDGYAATSAELYGSTGVVADTAGNLYFADSNNNVIRKVNQATGIITTVAGSGTWGYSGDGDAATSADLFDPMGVAVDAEGYLFIADTCNNVVRMVNTSGVITTIAGNGTWGYSGDGYAATSAQLDTPVGIAVDDGDLFIADSGNNVVRKVHLATGVITTVAGSYTLGSGYSGDGYAATSAQLNDPTAVAVDAAGNLFVADSCNNVIRKVGTTGTITTVAGSYTLGGGYSGDGYAATSAQLSCPVSIVVDAVGDLFIADTCNNVVRQVDTAGTITTIAGNGDLGYGGDSRTATSVQLNNPNGIALDARGNLFVADSVNNLIRKIPVPLYWDPSQTATTDTGGTGVWSLDSNDTFWYNPFLGADVAWGDGSDAIFSGTAATVTISGTVSPASMTFVATDYDLINASSGDGLALPTGGASINVAAESATIDAPITGNDTLTVTGPGMAVLGGENAYGDTDLESGSLKLGPGATLGSGRLTVNGGVIDLNGNSITVASLRSSAASDGVITNNDPLSPVTIVVDQDVNTGYFGGILDGDGVVSVQMIGSGVLVLDGSNTFSNGMTVGNGIVVLASSTAMPDGGPLTIGAGATLVFDPAASTPSANLRQPNSPHVPTDTPNSPGDGSTPPSNAPPTVSAIHCAGTSLVDADTVVFLVSFSKTVTGVLPGNFAARGIGGTVTSVSGSAANYAVTVSVGGGGSGSLGLAVVNTGTITDWLGNPLTGMVAIPVNECYTIDRRLYWDGSGSQSNGNWNGMHWHVGSPTGPVQGWLDGSDAFFAGTAGTVEVTDPVAVSSLTFLSDGWVLDGSTVSLGCLPTTIDVACGMTTIDCPIAGVAMAKTGNGTLALGGTTSCSSLTVGGGVLQTRARSALPGGMTLLVNGGVMDLGGTTPELTSVTLLSGTIVDGGITVDGSIELYSGAVLADLNGPASLEKLGAGTVVVSGHNTYGGGTTVSAGTLVVARQDSLPSAASGEGTVVIEPTLYWSGSGDWTTGRWELADGTPSPWIDGSNAVVAANSLIDLSGVVNFGTLTLGDRATIDGGTLALPTWGGIVTVPSGTATIHSTLTGGILAETGPGTLVLDGTLGCGGMLAVEGTLDLLSPPETAPLIAGGQTVGPGAVFSSGGQSLYTLDPALFSLVQSLFVDQSIDRADMIQVFRSAVVEGAVSDTTLDALETLTTPRNETCLNMPDYVRVLSRDVVDGNPANAKYQGQPLGNLADQASGQLRANVLNHLVDKWFYGTDLPGVPAGVSYSAVAGPLFGNSPDPALQVPASSDMEQGSLGDCYFIAALGALADSSPAAIENMFIDNGVENGVHTWTVRFYWQDVSGAYVPEYVTVNAMLPAVSNGRLVFAQAGPNGSYWMPLLEKAYAQWNETRHEGRDGLNNYASLNGGWMDVVDTQVLGRNVTNCRPTADLAVKQTLIEAIRDQKAVTAAIFGSYSDALFCQRRLVSRHAYQVASYDADPDSPTFDTFQLRNPWGCYEPAPLTWQELCAYCPVLVIADPSSSEVGGACALGMSSGEVHAAALAAVVHRQLGPNAVLSAITGWHKFPAVGGRQEQRARACDFVLGSMTGTQSTR